MTAANTGRGTVLVTGASRGLGRNMAIYLSGRGFHVFAGCRNPADVEAFIQNAPVRLTPLLLDVTNEQSIADAVEKVSEAVGEGGLQGIVNNAGVAAYGPVEQIPVHVVEEQLRVNVVAPIILTQRFLPQLRFGRGRIVNISSVAGFVAPPYMGIYSASKFALEAFSDALRVELKPWGIHVSVVRPGISRSDIRARSMESWAARRASSTDKERSLYDDGFRQTTRLIADFDEGADDPQEVSEVVFEALTANPPQTRYLVGQAARDVAGLLSLSDEARDEAFLQMWQGAAT